MVLRDIYNAQSVREYAGNDVREGAAYGETGHYGRGQMMSGIVSGEYEVGRTKTEMGRTGWPSHGIPLGSLDCSCQHEHLCGSRRAGAGVGLPVWPS